MFSKILIANRGEIACRVIATARKMGIATVAVYSEADQQAHFVQCADEAVLLGPAPSRASYLAAERIIAAARQTGAQAIHPGYGFLSENAAFARQVEEAGLTFIGPTSAAIAAMGDKIASRQRAQQARLNTIPGCNHPIGTPEQAVEVARRIGYPVMIKASAGGGGKGLRVAFDDRQAHAGFISCRNEAQNSFGDDRVFIEKCIEEPRHIEIQVLGDAHGNVVHLWERECSIQRRHQKLIEEAPSPFISEATRQAMGAQAVALAKAVQFQSAGTVEFVVGKDQDFYFLEMNTRLQVEHPVTECITGLDLVEQMIRVAAGEALAFGQDDIPREGWAIECRINAEDPSRNFLPSTGRLVRFEPPPQTLFQSDTGQRFGVRVDTGVCEGGEIPMHYDSMIAKLIVHGQDRHDAMGRMREALNGFVIRGVSSNIPFQAALLSHPEVVAGRFTTGFIAQHYPDGFRAEAAPHDEPEFLLALAAWTARRFRDRASRISGQFAGQEVRVGQAFVVVALDAREGRHVHTDVRIDDFRSERSQMLITVGDKRYALASDTLLGSMAVQGTVNGQPFTAQIERGVGRNPLALRISHDGCQVDAMVLSRRGAELHRLMPFKAPPDWSKFLLSPMSGLLVDVVVQEGQAVRAGERLAVIEAMKMENVLVAAQDGVVSKVVAAAGDALMVDQVIMEFA